MRNYKEGDMVVMNTDRTGECYIDEQLMYIGKHAAGYTRLRTIHGHHVNVPNDSFDLRDKPTFEIGERIEASNQEDFEIVDQVYFVADASHVKGFYSDRTIIATDDMVSLKCYKYARKYVEKSYTIKHDCVEYNVSREIKEKVDAAIQEAIDYSKNN